MWREMERWGEKVFYICRDWESVEAETHFRKVLGLQGERVADAEKAYHIFRVTEIPDGLLGTFISGDVYPFPDVGGATMLLSFPRGIAVSEGMLDGAVRDMRRLRKDLESPPGSAQDTEPLAQKKSSCDREDNVDEPAYIRNCAVSIIMSELGDDLENCMDALESGKPQPKNGLWGLSVLDEKIITFMALYARLCAQHAKDGRRMDYSPTEALLKRLEQFSPIIPLDARRG